MAEWAQVLVIALTGMCSGIAGIIIASWGLRGTLDVMEARGIARDAATRNTVYERNERLAVALMTKIEDVEDKLEHRVRETELALARLIREPR